MERWMNTLMRKHLEEQVAQLQTDLERVEAEVLVTDKFLESNPTDAASRREIAELKAQRTVLQTKMRSERLAGITAGPAPPAAEQRSPMARMGLDRCALRERGVGDATITKLHRTLYVFTISFHEQATALLRSCGGDSDIMHRLWTAYSLLTETIGGVDAHRGSEGTVRKVLVRNSQLQESLAVAKARRDAANSELRGLQSKVRSMQDIVGQHQEVLQSHEHETKSLLEAITVLQIEKDSLSRKNQFLSDQLLRVKTRDQAQAAVRKIGMGDVVKAKGRKGKRR